MESYEKTEVKLAEKYTTTCHCGHNHISSLKAMQNYYVNKRPLNIGEELDVHQAINKMGLGDVGEEMKRITIRYRIPLHKATSMIVKMHEQDKLSYNNLMKILSVLS